MMKTLRKRSEIAPLETWNLTPLYPTLNDWERDYSAVEARLADVAQFKGHVSESADQLYLALETYMSVLRILEKVYTYSHLRHDEDMGESGPASLHDRATNLYSRFAAAASYLQPELLLIPTESLEQFLQSEKLKPYERTVREMVRYRPHTLSEKEESLLAQGSEVFGSAYRIFSQLNNVDLSFGNIETDDGEVTISHATYPLLLRSHNRDLRARAFDQYLTAFSNHRNTLAAVLAAGVKKTVFLAQARNFNSALESALFADEVPVSVYKTLIDTVSDALPVLHRYFEVRKNILKVPDLRIYDNYVPLASDVKMKHSFQEACDLVIDACSPLGSEYVEVLKAGLTSQRWVDIWENQGKRSGAYSSGCYDSPPYILMNYQEDVLDQVFTLAHEAGHSMHSHFSRQHQTYQDHQYTIFVAEVASVLNEQLLLNVLRRKYADNPTILKYLLNHQVDEAFGTFFTQIMYSEYELKLHLLAEANEALTTERLVDEYSIALKKYLGPVFTYGELEGLNGLRIPHFYYNFYVYKYATGYMSAVALAQKIIAGDQEATQRYLNFLKSGSTKPSLELLREAGVDLTTRKPIDDTIRAFAGWVDELAKAYGVTG